MDYKDKQTSHAKYTSEEPRMKKFIFSQETWMEKLNFPFPRNLE